MNGTLTAREVLREIDSLAARGKWLVRQGGSDRSGEGDFVPDPSRDIDYWAPREHRTEIREYFSKLGGYVLCTCTSPRWLNHDVYLFPCTEGNLQVDISTGDLMVGPVTFASEQQVLGTLSAEGRLGGVALIADLLLRPLARGKKVAGRRLEQAVGAWKSLDEGRQRETRQALSDRTGSIAARLCVEILQGKDRQALLMLHLRALTALRSLSTPGALKVATQKSWIATVGALTRRNKPFGRYHRGLLVAIIGTDGVGKSSSTERLVTSLAQQRMKVTRHYLGRARGNLPGIDAVRNLVGRRIRSAGPGADVYRYSFLNRLVTWYYAFEYCLRLLRPWFEARILGRIVLCDRYVYDLELIPGHSKLAARMVRWLVPRPDILVLLMASPDVIRSRKQERDTTTIEEHQASFRRLIQSGLARRRSITIRTDSLSEDEVRDRLLESINQDSHPDFR